MDLVLDRAAAASVYSKAGGLVSTQRLQLGLRGHICLKAGPVCEGLLYD